MRLFVDTSAFVALEDRSDRRHGDARTFFDGLDRRDRLLTSNYVVDETVTRLRYTAGHSAAVACAEALLASRFFQTVYVDQDIEREALAVLKRFRDKRLSFTDCTSAAIARRLKLEGVFAFDEDFVAIGLRAFP